MKLAEKPSRALAAVRDPVLAYFFIGYWLSNGMSFRAFAGSVVGGLCVYGVIERVHGLCLNQEEEYYGADLSIRRIGGVSQD